jgi:hypothetical protein
MSHLAPSASVLDHFSVLSDPRQRWRVLYPLPEILLLVLCASLSGMEDFVEIRPGRMPSLSTRSGGRRPKSANARNRGGWGTGGAAGSMGN